MTRWRYAAATDIGLVRQVNQDVIYVDDDLAIIADGMGGHAAGEVAAAISIDLVREGFQRRPSVDGLVEAIQGANTAVANDARENPEHHGMGTTVIAVGLTYDHEGVVTPTLVHVGDSRVYQLRDGAIRQLTEDHSVAEEWVRMGRLTPEEAAVHPRRHQLTRGIGIEDSIMVDVMSVNAVRGDRLLLCSDGLSNEVDIDTMARMASAPNGLEFAVESLVSAARAAGGRDNISVILLEFDEVNAPTTPVRRTMSTAPPSVERRGGGDGGNGEEGAARRGARPRRFLTWRVFAVLVVLVGVLGGAVAIVHWYAYSTYYLADDGPIIAVYQGQPSGVLWYQPVKVVGTSYLTSDLLPSDQRALKATISEPTVTKAIDFAAYMYGEWRLKNPVKKSTPTSTTTTSAPPVTTTTKKA